MLNNNKAENRRALGLIMMNSVLLLLTLRKLLFIQSLISVRHFVMVGDGLGEDV